MTEGNVNGNEEREEQESAPAEMEAPQPGVVEPILENTMADAETAPGDEIGGDDVALAQRLREAREALLRELRKRVIGQESALEQVILSLFVGGNSIITGVPGLAKTLIVQSIAEILQLDFNRIQFTPDLMPADITGTDIIQEDSESGQRKLVFMPGPVFCNVLLADEINRTPPKTQSALLEAMQEHRVTIQGTTYPLSEPFYVFATQNPIELEGTYPLPEAQLDRFMFDIVVDYLPEDEELEVIRTTTSEEHQEFVPTITGADLLAFMGLVRRVPVTDRVLRYTMELVRSSRPSAKRAPEFVRKWVDYGGSVRAAQYLILGGKARALTRGRFHVAIEDVKALAHPVLRHRILTNFHAESERVSSDDVIDQLLAAVPEPRSTM